MKKTLLISFVTSFICTQAFAQQWRVVSCARESFYNGVSTHLDSTRYYYDYNKGRGSSKMADSISYDSSHKFTFNAGVYMMASGRIMQHFDNKDRVISRAVIEGTSTFSEERFGYTATDKPSVYTKYYTKYSGPNQPHYSAWDDYHFYYDSLDRLKTMTYKQRFPNNGLPTVIDFTTSYRYDGNSNPVMDTSYSYSILGYGSSTMNIYEYDGAGNLARDSNFFRSEIDTQFQLNRVHAYKYDSYNRMISDSTLFYGISTGHHYYTYYPNGDLYTDTLVSGTGTTVTVYEYYSYGMIAKIVKFKLNGTVYDRIEEWRYNYEIYWPQSIAETGDNAHSLQVYPVPSSDILNITATMTHAGIVEGTITDMQSKVLSRWRDNIENRKTPVYSKQVPVSGLAPGNYIISIDAGKSRVSQQFVVR